MTRQSDARREEAQRYAGNGSRITRQTISQTGIVPLPHCGATTIVAIVCVCVCVKVESGMGLFILDIAVSSLPLPMGCNWQQQQQQLVAAVAHFLSELTIAVRLLTVMICPMVEPGRWCLATPGEFAICQLGKLIGCSAD